MCRSLGQYRIRRLIVVDSLTLLITVGRDIELLDSLESSIFPLTTSCDERATARIFAPKFGSTIAHTVLLQQIQSSDLYILWVA